MAGAGDNACTRAPASSGDQSRRRSGKATSLGRRRVCPGRNACTRGRQRMRPGDNVCARATTGGTWEGCFFTNTALLTTASTSGRRRMRAGDNRAAPVRRRVPRGRGVFSQTPQTSTLGRRRLRPGDNGCARAMTSALARRRLDPIVLTLAFFFAFAIQTKLFHYLFSRITQIVLKMVIQSYFY